MQDLFGPGASAGHHLVRLCLSELWHYEKAPRGDAVFADFADKKLNAEVSKTEEVQVGKNHTSILILLGKGNVPSFIPMSELAVGLR